jgi:GH18 family chitinase
LANDTGRQTFVRNITSAYYQYRLDGIDIDWEYPGEPGDPRNYVDANDTANFLKFLKLLRTTLPSAARITAAVQTTPFANANGQSMDYVRAFAEVLDWVLIMNYDTWEGALSLNSFSLSCPLNRLQLHPIPDRTPPLTTPVKIPHYQRQMPLLR